MLNRLFQIFMITLCMGTLVAWADDAIEPPVPVRTVSPKYPPDLKHDGVSGVVTINCTIDEKGNVTEPKVLKSTNEAFSQPALEALAKWKFKPAKKGGEVISIKITIPIQFTSSQ